MTTIDRQLAELEDEINRQRRSGRAMLKALSRYRQGPLHTSRPEHGQGIDLLKAETQMRDLDRRGVLTRAQSEAAWTRLRALRPAAVIKWH
jgi:hypothetical protein